MDRKDRQLRLARRAMISRVRETAGLRRKAGRLRQVASPLVDLGEHRDRANVQTVGR